MRTILALVAVVCAARTADAGRIPVIYQSGLESFESGPLPSPYDKELPGWTAGYVCDVTGVLYTYFAIGDCRPAALHDHSYRTDEQLAAAIRTLYPEESIPFWSRHGWKLLFGLIVVSTVAAILLRQRDDEDDDEEVTQPVRVVPPVDPHDIEGLTERVREPAFYKRRVVASNSLQYGVTQPLVRPPVQPPAPPRRAARGSFTERDYQAQRDAADTQLGWRPPPPSRPQAARPADPISLAPTTRPKPTRR
jgi:hypothetical protein